MVKFILLNFIALFSATLLFVSSANAQKKFAAAHSKWTYSIYPDSEMRLAGFAQYEVEKDTLYYGKLCSKVIGKVITETRTSDTFVAAYFYSSADTVFYYNNNFSAFFPLYIFDVKVGDTISYPSPQTIAGKPDSFRVVVYEIKPKLYDGISLKTISTKALDHYKIDFYTERVGSLHSFSEPSRHYPYSSGLGLICYSDDEIDTNSTKGDCIDFSVSIREEKNDETFTLFPNPASNKITILHPDLNNSCQFQIYDHTGKKISVLSTSSTGTIDIDVKNLSSGLYFICIYEQTGHILKTMKFSKN